MKRQRLNHNTETPTNTYTDMALFDRLTQRARENRQRIVLPEGTEPRTCPVKHYERYCGLNYNTSCNCAAAEIDIEFAPEHTDKRAVVHGGGYYQKN